MRLIELFSPSVGNTNPTVLPQDDRGQDGGMPLIVLETGETATKPQGLHLATGVWESLGQRLGLTVALEK